MPLLVFVPLLVLALLALRLVLLLSAWVTTHWYEAALVETAIGIVAGLVVGWQRIGTGPHAGDLLAIGGVLLGYALAYTTIWLSGGDGAIGPATCQMTSQLPPPRPHAAARPIPAANALPRRAPAVRTGG